MLSIKGFKKFYSGNLILDVPDLVLEKNIYWLKGQNGSGKTTLMKAIAGLIPFDGEISIEGINIFKQRIDYRYIVNYAEAEPVYPDFLTGADLIKLYTETKKASQDQVGKVIGRLDIKSYIKNKAGSYSSGMIKKLSLALSFLGNPKLILLDEPFITLDQNAIINLNELITEYHHRDVCFIIASHQDFDESFSLLPKKLFLQNNTVV